MRSWDRMLLRLRSLLWNRQERERLRAELEFHVEALTAENVAAGMAPEAARRAAIQAFGNTTLFSEKTQATWGWTWLERILQDVRFATRQIRRAPGFAVIAILTLGLGIGANTAVFSLTHALLLRGLPIAEPDRLVRLALDFTGAEPNADTDVPLNVPLIEALNRRARSFEGVLGWTFYGFRPEHGDNTRRGILGAAITGNAFQLLGIHPAVGRLIDDADDKPGGGPDGWAGVISYRDWVQRYHADPSIVGRHIHVTDHPVTIVGVAPQGFEGVFVGQHPDLYLPLEFDAALNSEAGLHNNERLWLVAYARLRPGVSREQAQAEMTALFPSVKKEALGPQLSNAPFFGKARFVVRRGATGFSDLQMEYTKPLILLQTLVGAVLLICCANLSGLLLARAAARQQEFAVRAALGAARGRLIRQLMVESLMLALPGALLGIALAWAAGPWMLRLLGSNHQDKIALSVRPDFAVLAVTVACAVVCALLFGMAPAWAAGKANGQAALSGMRSQTALGGSSLRRFFVPFQVAMSLVLVVIAGLLVSTLVHLRTDDSGYKTSGVYFFVTDFNRIPQHGAAEVLPLYRRITDLLRTEPGVVAAGTAEWPPLFDMGEDGKFAAGDTAQRAATVTGFANDVGNGYFDTVGIPLLEGRAFHNDETDVESCIVNEKAAMRIFQTPHALGRTLRQVPFDPRDPNEPAAHNCEVVGVVRNSKYDTLLETFPPIVYRPLSARTRSRITSVFLAIKAQSSAAADAAQHAVLSQVTPTAPESDPIVFTDIFNDSSARQRLLSVLSGFFAGLALLLSGIGIYGLVAWNVTQRTMEIGVRMALGATRVRVFTLVMRQVAWMLAIGVGAGGVTAFFAARSIRSFLFEVQPGSPLIFAAAALGLVSIGVLAAALPARRAVSIDPMQALRAE